MDLAAIGADLGRIFSGRRWILLADAAVAATPAIEQLRAWGADEFLVVAGSPGVGRQPDVDMVLMPSPPGTVMEGFRRFAANVARPPPEVVAAVERFDPDGTARALGPLFGTPPSFLDRPLYGARPAEWEALEDKIGVEQIWQEAGISTASSVVVPLDEAPGVLHASGSVWAADNSDGWHGGGEYVRWVPAGTDGVAAAESLRGRAARVRVMPFLEGLPCSIHGVVTDGGVAALRPVELLILRTPDPGFLYAGVATSWDPPDPVRGDMRAAAGAVGEVLRSRVDYRGPFSIDGVLTVDGFLPTELNPRFSVGFAIQASTVEALPTTFLVRAMVEGDVDVDADDLERLVVERADANRVLRMGVAVPEVRADDERPLGIVDGRVSAEVTDGAALVIGPSPAGSFVRWKLEGSAVPTGSSFAPYVAQATALAAEAWDLDLPVLEAAPDVTG